MSYEPKSDLGKLVQALAYASYDFAPLLFSGIDGEAAMRQADRIAEIERYDGCDGCSTGDCNHDTQEDCVLAQGRIIAEQAEELNRLKGVVS